MLSAADRATLLDMARESIQCGLTGTRLPVVLDRLSESLRAPRASFVTLLIDDQLHGCIGTLEAYRPLAEDVMSNAYGAAFEDPRFERLSTAEFSRVVIQLSLLSRPEPMQFVSEQDLLDQIRPGVDGLVLNVGAKRATFLPSVWAQLPDRRVFLQQLKRKAGLDSDKWSASIRVSRYRTESIA